MSSAQSATPQARWPTGPVAIRAAMRSRRGRGAGMALTVSSGDRCLA
jgi:hypothetical protein